MAARRFLFGRPSLFENPIWWSRSSLCTRKVSVSSQPNNGGSKWLAKALFSTATVLGTSVLVLEYVPGAQEAIDHHFPGFIEEYGRNKRRVNKWYEEAVDYLSGRSSKPEKKQDASFEPARMKPAERPFKLREKVKEDKTSHPTKPPSAETSTPSAKGDKKKAVVSRQDSGKKSNDSKQKEKASQRNLHEERNVKTTKPTSPQPQTTEKAKTSPPPPPPPPVTAPLAPVAPDTTAELDLKETQHLDKQDTHNCELLQAMQDYSSMAESTIRSHDLLADTVDNLSQGLSHAVEKTGNVEEAVIALAAAKEQTAVVESDCREALKMCSDAQSKLRSAIQTAVSSELHEQVEEAESLLKKMEAKLDESRQAASGVLDRSSPLFTSLEKKIAQLREESGQVGSSKTSPPSENVEELYAMLVVSREQTEAMKKRIKELEDRDQEMVNQAMKLQESDIEKSVQERLADALSKEQQSHRESLEKQAFELESFYEQKLREQIKRQLIFQAEEMQTALSQQHQELSKEYSMQLKKRLEEMEDKHQVELARSMAHLQAVDGMIDTISSAGHEVKKQQELRAACETLNKALQNADKDEETELHSFAKELSALKTSASDDKFVLAVLEGMPKAVLAGGEVPSLLSLYTRFDKVLKVCHRVALVPEHGGLGSYLVSSIAGMLTFNTLPYNIIDRETPLDKMDTYELLHQAEAYVNHGDLEMAARCLNQLQGEPRRVAGDWLSDARLYLEMRQATKVIAEYVAASSVSLS
jgi:mitofilin